MEAEYPIIMNYFVFTEGKHQGLRVEDVALDDYEYFRWCYPAAHFGHYNPIWSQAYYEFTSS